jgi:hypothetical protein
MSALKEPVESLDSNKPLALTRSIHTFNEIIKMHIGEMTGQVRKPYHGLSVRCRGDQCTYKLKTREIIADGNCLFDSLLYILGREQTRAAQMALRRELYQHFIHNKGTHNHNYDLEDAKVNKHIYASTHVLKSFTEIYQRHVIVFELHNSGVFNAHLFINRTVPFDHVDFLILTQNPGHFTTFTKDRGFVQSRAFLEKILDLDYAWRRGDKIRDLIRPGQVIPDFEERNYSQVIFSNYDQFMDTMMTDVALPQLPDNLGLPPLPPHLTPLLPPSAFPSMVEANGLAIGRAMMSPGSSHSRSPSLSPATKAAIAKMNRSHRRSHKSHKSHKSRGSRSPSLSPSTKAAIAAMNALARRSRSRSGSLSPATKKAIAQMNALARRSRSASRSASRSGSLSPATKKRIARLALIEAPNASPTTKNAISRLALNEAPNASINTMTQIGRLQKGMTQRRNPLRNGGEDSNSPPADLRRTGRFKPSSIVGRGIARPFARIFGKFS